MSFKLLTLPFLKFESECTISFYKRTVIIKAQKLNEKFSKFYPKHPHKFNRQILHFLSARVRIHK